MQYPLRMSLYDAGIWAAAALLIAAFFYVPRKITAQRRLRVGMLLFVIGWAGILSALLLNVPSLQSEAVAYGWMGSSALAGVVGSLFLVSAFYDWLGPTRPRHQRRRFPPFR